MPRSPQRSCIGCRDVRDKKDLVRLVRTPDDRYLVDSTGSAAGRGAYLCPSAACLNAAVKRKSFDRAFRRSLSRETTAALEAAFQDYLRAGSDAAAPEGRQARFGEPAGEAEASRARGGEP
jgi:uncharacterized protein